MGTTGGAGAPWWLAGSAVALWLVREAWGAIIARRKNRAETDANVELINSLRQGLDRMDQKIRSMEEAQARMQDRLEQEIKLRQAAEQQAHRLRLRVDSLVSVLKGLGAVIPPDPLTD